MKRRSRRAVRRMILAACFAGVLILGVVGGWLGVRAGVIPGPPPQVLRITDGRVLPDPLTTTADRYEWVAQPDPAFPIPPYARYLKGLTIVLDPGHIGQSLKGRGADWKRGPTGLWEGDVNLRVANYLREFLSEAGANVLLTREKNEPRDIPDAEDLADRARIANAARADLLLSIHHNGVEKPEPNFTTVFYHGDGTRSPASLAAARQILYGLNDALRLEKLTEIPLWSDLQIAERSGFGVLRLSEGPAVLSEASFHTNPAEEDRLRDPVYNRREAYGMFLGLARWAQSGLPRVTMVEPSNRRVQRGKTVTLQLDDGLSKRDGRGARATRVLGASLRIELDGLSLNYSSLNQQKGELKFVIPTDTPRKPATLFVDFQNIFGQHVTHPRIMLQIE